MTIVMMMSILTSAFSASCSFYSYTPHFPSPFSLPSLSHYALIVIIIIGTAYTGGIPEGYDEDTNMANNTSTSHTQDSTHISSDVHQENRDGQKTIFPASIDSLFDFIDSEWGLSKKQVSLLVFQALCLFR